MSCFGGKTYEYDELSLDRFDGINLSSAAYFLSHCHADHMVGLESHELSKRFLDCPDIKLYCSTVTASLLLAIPRFTHLRAFIEELPMDQETAIHIPFSNSYISVTLIPAGHCPGSAMILVHGDNGTILYTGDFRFSIGDSVRLKSLFTLTKGYSPKFLIKSVYIDTTFCIPEAVHIPTREACLQVIISTASDWFIRKGPSALLHVFSRSSYGYEFIMVQLAKKYSCKIHVSAKQFEKYRFVPSIQRFLTEDPNSTQIHFCQNHIVSQVEENLELCKQRTNFDKTALPCTSVLRYSPHILQIVPSVMFFTKSKDVSPTSMVYCEGESVVRVCYSSHCSYGEIIDFLSVLKPQNIYPNVKPNNEFSLEDVRKTLMHLQCQEKQGAKRPQVDYAKVSFTSKLRRMWYNIPASIPTADSAPTDVAKLSSKVASPVEAPQGSPPPNGSPPSSPSLLEPNSHLALPLLRPKFHQIPDAFDVFAQWEALDEV